MGEPEDVSFFISTLDEDGHQSPSIMEDHHITYDNGNHHHWGLKRLNMNALMSALAELRNNELSKSSKRDSDYKIKKLNRQWGIRSDRLYGVNTVEFHRVNNQRESLLKNIGIRRPMQIPSTPVEMLI